MIISGIEQHLRQNNFLFLTVIHRHDKNCCKRIRRCCNHAVWRALSRWTLHHGTAGAANSGSGGPSAGDRRNEYRAGSQARGEDGFAAFANLGHGEIAFLKGQTFSSDSIVRWDAIVEWRKSLAYAFTRS